MKNGKIKEAIKKHYEEEFEYRKKNIKYFTNISDKAEHECSYDKGFINGMRSVMILLDMMDDDAYLDGNEIYDLIDENKSEIQDD